MVSREEAQELALALPEPAVRVDLLRIDRQTLESLLADAWEGKATKRLLG